MDGLRIDHPDGLYDPRGYLRELQARGLAPRATSRRFYVLVEKILTGDEPLPDDWPVAGTVGYDFLNRLNGLFVRRRATPRRMDGGVRAPSSGGGRTFAELVYEKKKLILRVALASELNVLAYLLDRLSEQNRRFRDFTLGSLTRRAARDHRLLPRLPHLHRRAHRAGVAERDRRVRGAGGPHGAVRRNREHQPRRSSTSSATSSCCAGPRTWTRTRGEEHARFVMKFQQLTGPVMAKGVEDTTFYVYNRLVSLNEVGGEPERFGVSPEQFHAWIARRAAQLAAGDERHLHPRHQAQRGRAGAHRRALGDARALGGARADVGAS